MNYIRFVGSDIVHEVNLKQISPNLVQINAPIPSADISAGFEVLTRPKNGKVFGDYKKYTTIYGTKEDGSIVLSNDGSIYNPPSEPDYTPEEPYEPTLEQLQETKVTEMNNAQQSAIQQGLDITLSDGTVEHFTLKDQDQTSLMGLQTLVAQGLERIPWHNADQSEHCKYYSNADMAIITSKALQFVTFHVTYFRDLRIYVRALEDKEAVSNVFYGMSIPEKYQSDVLKDFFLRM